MTLRLNSSGGGYVEADAPNIAGNYALTLPTSAGSAGQYLRNSATAGTLEFGSLPVDQGPTFKATLSANQTLTASTWTKVQFNTESWDTDSDYDNSTNYRFTPSKAGYYLATASLHSNWTSSQYTYWISSIYKNGSLYTFHRKVVGTSVNDYGTVSITDLVYLNGTSDYIEAYVWSDAGGPYINYDENTFFNAVWVHE